MRRPHPGYTRAFVCVIQYLSVFVTPRQALTLLDESHNSIPDPLLDSHDLPRGPL
jgi:hypothetical protein